MFVLGVTGGIGCGKSEVLRYLESKWRARAAEADAIGFCLQKKGGPAYEPIVRLFGESILLDDGELDRTKIAGIVFHDSEKLEQLNAIVHPLVKDQIFAEMEREEAAGCPLFVVESAILIEVGYKQFCDEVWYINAPEQVRLERLFASRGMTREKAQAVMKRQLTPEQYGKACDYTIDNGGSAEQMQAQIDRRLSRILPGRQDTDREAEV